MFGIADKIGEAAVERTFLGLLEDFSAEDLDAAAGAGVSLLGETARQRPRTLAMARRIARRFRGQERHLTFDNVMEWLRDKRPDFYTRIRFRGEIREWLARNVAEIREFLFG